MVISFVMNLRCKAYEFIIKETVPSDRNLGIRFPESRYRLKRNSGTVAPERRFRIARNTQIHLGYLGYDQDSLSAFVPNEEIRQKLTAVVMTIQ